MWIFSLAVVSAFSAGPQLEDFGYPLQNKELVVAWMTATNQFPASLNVYQVGTAAWSPEFLSNIVTLGEFKEPSIVLKALAPALNGQDARFSEDAPRGSRKSLVLNPSKGRLYFRHEGVIALPREPVMGVPSEDKVLDSALAILSKLNISKDQLRRKLNSEELFTLRDVTTHGQRDKATGKVIKEVIARGVFIYRRVDGIGVAGRGTCGGLHVNFGNNGRIAEMELVWRNIHSPRRLPVADTNQIAKWIRQGKATTETEEDPSAIKRLTVTNAVVFYFGNNGSEHQSNMYPFVNLGAVAELNEKRISLEVNCPLVED